MSVVRIITKLKPRSKRLLERDLSGIIGRNLKKHGYLTFRIENSIGQGFPDMIVISPAGRTTYIELKVGTPRLRPSQRKTLGQMVNNHAPVYVAWAKAGRVHMAPAHKLL